MSETHTPGPWEIGDHHFRWPSAVDVVARSRTICRVDYAMDEERGWSDDEELERVKANARLIAAAPALLAVAEEVLVIAESEWADAVDNSFSLHIEEPPHHLAALRAAVAEAQPAECSLSSKEAPADGR